jgi:uncharacterized protein with von Willebrand factor type A (vWA) domain
VSTPIAAWTELPRAARPFAEFADFLRGLGFAVAPEQTVTFMAATNLLGPRTIADIRRAAHASFAPHPERMAAFDAAFDEFFVAGVASVAVEGNDDADEVVVKDDRGRSLAPPEELRSGEAGAAVTRAELLARRVFAQDSADEQLRRFVRKAPDCLPRRRAFRRAPARTGDAIDMRRTLRRALANDGDLPGVIASRRTSKTRNILLLIDISGSMKQHTADYLKFAHALTQAADRVETFTLGTRLTRITRAMLMRDRGRALAEAAQVVDDWDGGTRIGEALGGFLRIPRFAGQARGAFALVLSDGLESGDPGAMVDAVRRLSRRVWRLAWLTPLAADPRFRPATQALTAILPWLDDFGDGGSIESLVSYVLGAASGDERWRAARWRELSHP